MAEPHPPIRIALLTRRYPPLIGGAEAMLRYLAVALAETGAEVSVFTSRLDPALPPEETAAVGRGSLRVLRLTTSPLRFIGTFLYMRGLRRTLAALRPDVAYVSMLKHDAYVAVGVGRRLGFPVVLRPEGAGATGDIAWQGWGRFGRRIATRCREADAFVAISAAVRRELEAAGYPADRIVDLPNGVPVPASPWTERPGWSDAPRAVYVGRLAPEKGLRYLVDAWPIVVDRHPRATLSLFGEGPERAALERRIAELGLAQHVHLRGPTDDAPARLREADLFALPSLEEGMSLALLEAMALGVPLVATSIPGNRRLVEPDVQGRLAPPADATALARAILDQWSDLDRAIRMGRAARSLVAREYSIDTVARAHRELFERLARNRPARPAARKPFG
jgi:glycosyltransferase involved in cell wall biosynthesis